MAIDGWCEVTGTYVQDSGTGSLQSHADFSGTCGGPVPSPTVISPDGGETWQAGTSHDVTWTYKGLPGETTIGIALFRVRHTHILTIAECPGLPGIPSPEYPGRP